MAEQTYTEPEASRALSAIPSWRVERGTIARTFDTDGWTTTLMLVNAIGSEPAPG
jgi:pterin-4a-carbinolamine dehydratase